MQTIILGVVMFIVVVVALIALDAGIPPFPPRMRARRTRGGVSSGGRYARDKRADGAPARSTRSTFG